MTHVPYHPGSFERANQSRPLLRALLASIHIYAPITITAVLLTVVLHRPNRRPKPPRNRSRWARSPKLLGEMVFQKTSRLIQPGQVQRANPARRKLCRFRPELQQREAETGLPCAASLHLHPPLLSEAGARGGTEGDLLAQTPAPAPRPAPALQKDRGSVAGGQRAAPARPPRLPATPLPATTARPTQGPGPGPDHLLHRFTTGVGEMCPAAGTPGGTAGSKR